MKIKRSVVLYYRLTYNSVCLFFSNFFAITVSVQAFKQFLLLHMFVDFWINTLICFINFRECPLSFSAIQGLLSLGLKCQEVELLVLPQISPHTVAGTDW